jgi:hypothetical protein
MTSSLDQPVQDFLDRLASRTATPAAASDERHRRPRRAMSVTADPVSNTSTP